MRLRDANTINIMPKCIDDKNMKNIVTIFISGEPNDAMDKFLVLNPPVAVTENA